MQLSLIIPCFNEHPQVLRDTVHKAVKNLSQVDNLEFEIIVVNDGSNIDYVPEELSPAVWIAHHENQGYGAALMSGILAARYEMVGIIDSDGTYPVDQLDKLVEKAAASKMVVGKRSWSQIPWVRRPAKYFLHWFASFMAGRDVVDLNSGMRIFEKSLVMKYHNLFPKRFSFTSTLTMIALTCGYRVSYVAVPYSKRIGLSSIKPIRDTISFLSLVMRLSLYFNPLRIFMPFSIVWFVVAALRGVHDYRLEGMLGNLCLILFFMGFQTFFFGLIAEIVNKRAG